MLPHLTEFRTTISQIMIKAIHHRVVIYGYGYTGQFLKWYAEYYHGIEVDYVISEKRHIQSPPYEDGLFAPSLFNMNYKDVKDAIVWVAIPLSDTLRETLEKYGYRENISYFDFFKTIYGKDITWPENNGSDPYTRHKTGQRDIQFMEYLEYKFGCNIINSVYRGDLTEISDLGGVYTMTDQRNLFPILDRAHIIPGDNDYIIDLGCGKGAPMISFLDYGFKHVGGVEMETGIYNVLVENIQKLGLDKTYDVECINSDATLITTAFDKYNYFFLFSPFYGEVFKKVAYNIKDSVIRNPRHIKIIVKYPIEQASLEEAGFVLTNQFLTNTAQRVISIYEL